MRFDVRLIEVASVGLLVLSGRMSGQVSYEPLGPPAPQSYDECEQFKSQFLNLLNQETTQAQACDNAYVNGCGMNTNCLIQNSCHNCWPQHTQCGDIWYQGKNCGGLRVQAACTQKNGWARYNQCVAEVRAFLQRQQAQEIAQQRAAAQAAAVQQSMSNAVTTLGGLLTRNNKERAEPTAATEDMGSSLAPSATSAGSSPLLDTSEYAKAYAVAASPDFQGVAEEWVRQKVEGSEHVFDAWKLAGSARAFSELQSSELADRAKGIGTAAKALLALHWGVYSLNPLSVEVSDRSIDVITTLAGQAFSSLDKAMGTALSQVSAPTTSGNDWDFNRTQAPIVVPYVAATPASVIVLPTSNAQDGDQDVEIGQFLKTLETPR